MMFIQNHLFDLQIVCPFDNKFTGKSKIFNIFALSKKSVELDINLVGTYPIAWLQNNKFINDLNIFDQFEAGK